MQRVWSAEELGERWSLLSEDLAGRWQGFGLPVHTKTPNPLKGALPSAAVCEISATEADAVSMPQAMPDAGSGTLIALRSNGMIFGSKAALFRPIPQSCRKR